MSVSIGESVESTERRLASLKAVKEIYPDAEYGASNRWISRKLRATDCDEIAVEDSQLMLCKRVGTQQVFPHEMEHRYRGLDLVVAHLKDNHPKLYRQLIAVLGV